MKTCTKYLNKKERKREKEKTQKIIGKRKVVNREKSREKLGRVGRKVALRAVLDEQVSEMRQGSGKLNK